MNDSLESLAMRLMKVAALLIILGVAAVCFTAGWWLAGGFQ